MTERGSTESSMWSMWRTMGSPTEGVLRSMPHLAVNPHGHPDVDRGWAWAVLFATTLWNFILGGTIKSFGVLYVELLNVFPNNSSSEIGLLGLVCGISATLVSPIAGRLSDIYSSRCMAIVGTCLTVIGLFASAFSQSLLLIILTYGVIFGSGMGIMDGPILAAIGKYWDKRRNMACGVAFAGSSVGNLAMAPLIALLINTYSVRGSFIILAGIWFNGCVVGALLRPIKKPKHRSTKPGPIVEKIGTRDEAILDKSLETSVSMHSLKLACNGALPVRLYSSQEFSDSEMEIADKEDCDLNSLEPLEKRQQICDDDDEEHPQTEPCLSVGEEKVKEKQSRSKRHNCWSTAISSLKANWCTMKWHPRESEYLQFLCNRKLMLNLFVVTCGMFGYYLPVIILPAYCQELGFSLYEGAGLLSILGIVEVISRLSLSTLVDLCHLKPGLVLVISYVLIGSLTQVALFYPTGHVLVAYACAHGVLGGLCMVFMSGLLVDAVGVAQLGSAMGLAVVSLNLTSSMAAFVAGCIQEVTGSYGTAIRLSAAIYFIGALTYILERLFSRCNRNRQNNRRYGFELPEIKVLPENPKCNIIYKGSRSCDCLQDANKSKLSTSSLH